MAEINDYQARCLAWWNDFTLSEVRQRTWSQEEITKAVSETAGRDIDIYGEVD